MNIKKIINGIQLFYGVEQFSWFILYFLGILVISLIHQKQHGQEAWTKDRIKAWKRSILFILIVYLFQQIFVYCNPGQRIYYDYHGFFRTIWEIIAFILIEDTLFYWTHRFFHSHPYIYKVIHSFHHQSRKNVSLVNGLQVTFIEFLLSIALPGAGPLYLIKMNYFVYSILTYISIFGVICDHGWDLFPSFLVPFPLNGTLHHKIHHERVLGNYGGPFSFWDTICKTHLSTKSL